jgi:hypothetical protein
VPLHPLSDINALADRVGEDGLDGAIASVPPPLFRPDLGCADCLGYTRLVNNGLLLACHPHQPTLRPLANLPVEAPELAAEVAAQLDDNWAGVVAGTELGVLHYALVLRPLDTVKRFYVDSLVRSPAFLDAITSIVGADRTRPRHGRRSVEDKDPQNERRALLWHSPTPDHSLKATDHNPRIAPAGDHDDETSRRRAEPR